MNAERCPTCFGRRSFKRLVEANPPYFADDRLEKVECPDCVEDVIEVVEAEADEAKLCPICGTTQLIFDRIRIYSQWVCLNDKGGCGDLAVWTCTTCFSNCWCQACYDKLEN